MNKALPKDDWKFTGNFRDLGGLDTTALAQICRNFPDARWATQRPDTYLAEYLEPIVLVQEESTDPLLEEFELGPHLRPVLQRLGDFYGPGLPVLISLVRLKAGISIPLHRDGPETRPAKWAHRTHIPLVTNESVKFRVGGEERHYEPGEMFEINNWREHAVSNQGFSDRIHLIVDWSTFT